MGYEAVFRDDPITLDPPLNGAEIDRWLADHPVDEFGTGGHHCSIRLDVVRKEKSLADGTGDMIVTRRAASFRIGGDDLREDSVLKDVRDLIAYATTRGCRVYGMLMQTDGHPDATYPVRWVVGNSKIEAQRPVLLYRDDPHALGALAVTVQQHTGVKVARASQLGDGSNHWGSDEAAEVAKTFAHNLYDALKKVTH